MRRWISASEPQTEAIGRELAAGLDPDATLLLEGKLGAGKTALARGIAAGLGIDPAEIQSPTYTLVREHAGRHRRLIHVDLYRLTSEETAAAGIEETIAGTGIKIVEWAERLPFEVPGARRIRITELADGSREILALD